MARGYGQNNAALFAPNLLLTKQIWNVRIKHSRSLSKEELENFGEEDDDGEDESFEYGINTLPTRKERKVESK
jgi:hypothetical protein